MEESFSKFQMHEVNFAPTPLSQRFCEQGNYLRTEGKLEEANQHLIQSIQLDRHNRAAYETLAKLYKTLHQKESLDIILSEKKRLEEFSTSTTQSSSDYQKILKNLTDIGHKTSTPRRVLFITNLFPPQEMGGFGKTMWEFAHGLIQKGHEVTVLTSNSNYLHEEPAEGTADIEPSVNRCLELYGDWKTGRAKVETDEKKIYAVAEKNIFTVRKWIERFQPDACVVGNIDLLGHPLLYELIARGIPIVHRLGNKVPGYPVTHTPQSPLYCMAPCSEWLKESLLSDGYPLEHFEILYPGSSLEQYYRYISPDFSFLRIAYASIIAPFKGLDVLIKALVELKKANIRFECHILGNATDQRYLNSLLSIIEEHALFEEIKFYGYQSRRATARIFNQCNTLVFPSTFEEPFGKTLIEAMAAGMTVVCSGTGGSPEIVQHEKTGLLFKNRDSSDLAEKLNFLSDNSQYAFELAQAGQQHCLKFSSANSIKKLNTIIEQMVNKTEV